MKDYLENHGFFIHLFLISDVYFFFIIYQVLSSNCGSKRVTVVENEKVTFNLYPCFLDFK